MSILRYLSILLSLSTTIIDSSLSKNLTIKGLTNTAKPTVTFNTFIDVSTSASMYPKSISKTTPSGHSAAPDEILIGEYKRNEDKLVCQAGKH